MKYLPNVLSAARIPLAILVLLACAYQLWVPAWWMLAVASLTDVIDGPLARRLNAVSKTGDWLDHKADFILLGGALTGLALGDAIPLRIYVACLAGAILGLLMSYVVRTRSQAVRRQQFRIGIIAFVGVQVALNLMLLSLAYGWHNWYAVVAVGIVAVLATTKRGRLTHPI